MASAFGQADGRWVSVGLAERGSGKRLGRTAASCSTQRTRRKAELAVHDFPSRSTQLSGETGREAEDLAGVIFGVI